jgi:hypothetical protein
LAQVHGKHRRKRKSRGKIAEQQARQITPILLLEWKSKFDFIATGNQPRQRRRFRLDLPAAIP